MQYTMVIVNMVVSHFFNGGPLRSYLEPSGWSHGPKLPSLSNYTHNVGLGFSALGIQADSYLVRAPTVPIQIVAIL